MSALRLGVPSKGRLMEDTLQYFRACGLKISKTGNAREYSGSAKGIDNIEVVFLQAGETPAALESGTIHLGVTGRDMILEKLSDGEATTALVRSLGFGQADLVVAVPQSWLDVETITDLDDAAAAFRAEHGFPMRVATKYLNSVRAFFRERGVVNYRLLKSDGATEGTPAAGAAEIVVDITSSGETLKANHLKIISDGLILRSEAQLRASVPATWSDTSLAALKTLVERIEAHASARAHVILRTDLAETNAELTAALSQIGVVAVSGADAAPSYQAPKSAAHAASVILREYGATRVESYAPEMLFQSGSTAFKDLRARLIG